MCQIDLLFLESQLSALKKIADDALGEECTISLYSDGSLSVETANTGRAFDTVREMISRIGEYKTHD